MSKEQLKQISEDVVEIKTVLLGVPNTEDTGLVGELKDLRRRFNKLSQKFYILVAFLAGSGVLGASIWGVLNGG